VTLDCWFNLALAKKIIRSLLKLAECISPMAPKRKAPETPETAASARRSTRISSSGKKSRYFEDESVDELSQEEDPAQKRSSKGTKAKAAAKSGARSTPNKRKKVASEDEDDVYYNDDEAPQDDAADDEDDDSFDEDAPPKVTYIPLPKLRDTGGIPYEDNRLHKNTMLFLKDLKANNKRTWLKCSSHLLSPLLRNLLSTY
jgi:hypothetical protein